MLISQARKKKPPKLSLIVLETFMITVSALKVGIDKRACYLIIKCFVNNLSDVFYLN